MKKLSKKYIIILVVLICSIVVGIGGKIYMDKQHFHNEMVKVVKSEEAKKVIEEGLKNLDSKALTPEGKIKSYEIDYDSIEHNPMGAIMFNVFINNDNRLVAKYDLDKLSGNLEVGGIGLSEELSDLVGEVSND